MKEIRLKNWAGYEAEIDRLSGDWIFRGQSDSGWEINSSIYRFFLDAEIITGKKNEKHRETIENNIIDEFSSHAHLFTNAIPDEDNPLEWLSLMQHYGCPTRLLDVTCSPYVATFFALDSGICDAAIYAVNAEHFSKINGEEIQSVRDAYSFLKQRKNETSQLALYSPRLRSERIVIQQGLFIVPNTLTKPIDDVLDDYCFTEDQAIKFVLPAEQRMYFIRKLLDMNITSSTLYQGLEGYCKSLKNILLHDANTPSSKRRKNLNKSIQRTPLTLRR